MATHLIVRPCNLPNRISSHPPISKRLSRSQQLQRIFDFDIGPARQEHFDRLLDLSMIGPDDGLEKFGERSLVTSEVEAMSPNEIALMRRELLRRRIV